MSEADVELLRRGYQAFNRRDMAGLMAFLHPEAVWIPSPSAWGAGRAYHGHDGVASLLEDLAREWEEFEVEPDEFRQVGDLVLVLGTVRARAKGGKEIRAATAWIWELREGRALRLQAYTDQSRALEALGVPE